MPVLIILVSIVLVILGYRFARQVDMFTGAELRPEKPRPPETEVLLFGPSALLIDLEALLRGNNISYLELTVPLIPAGVPFLAMIALSDSETENILLCREARRLAENVFTLARCPDPIYRWLFEQEGIDCVMIRSPSADAIFCKMEGCMERWQS